MSASDLRFLADESCDHSVVRALRAAGYDVVAVAELTQRSVDMLLIEQAWVEKRILLTEDKDFGWLVYVSHSASSGVVLTRFPGNARRALVQTMLDLVREHGSSLRGAFVVLQPGHVRIDPGPSRRG